MPFEPWSPAPPRRSLRLGLVCPPISGHLNPALSVGNALRERGHQVAYFGLLDAERAVRAAGLEFVPLAAQDVPLGEIPRRMQRQGELSGMAALRFILRCLLDENLAYCRELPAAVQTWGADGLMLDQIVHGAASTAQHLGLPYVTLCNALALHSDPAIPPFNVTWPYGTGWLARGRNWLGYRLGRAAISPYFGPLNAQRQVWGLGPLSFENQGESPLAQLSQQPAGFEFPGRRFPSCFHFTGPWTRPQTRASVSFPWERLDGRPLIYASLGTLQNRIVEVFRTIATACVDLDAQLVLSLGSPSAPVLEGLPGDPIVVNFAPQLELLRRATLVITHAGLNTTLESLREGVPMVAIPIANDQPGVAARLKFLGAGEFVPLRRLTAFRLRTAVKQVLENPGYRAAARRRQEEIVAANGWERAASVIESVLAPAAVNALVPN